VLARLKREPLNHLPIFDHVDQLCRDCDHLWRERVLTPLVTLRLFLLQVLHGNAAITHLRRLASMDFAPSSYCEARKRLPLEVILGLLQATVAWANDHLRTHARLLGQRVLIVDGSSFSTVDSPELHKHFGLYPGAKPGVSYPMGKLLGLMDSASGLFVRMLALPVLVHDMSNVVAVHSMLQAGDILLGDRAFCSFAHFVLLSRRGVFACCRLHQMRKSQHGRRGAVQWRKGQRPAWISPEQYAAMPQLIQVRLVSYVVPHAGFRSQRVTVATTLLDEKIWPDERIAALYGQRWEIETCFDHLKTSLKMNQLKCQDVAGVQKELLMYLLAYNLVRLAMLMAAEAQRVAVKRISFIDAARWLSVRMQGLGGSNRLIVNPLREGRVEPRVIRGRMKAYDLMVRPRNEMKMAGKTKGNA
jgi:hypothetical protein